MARHTFTHKQSCPENGSGSDIIKMALDWNSKEFRRPANWEEFQQTSNNL